MDTQKVKTAIEVSTNIAVLLVTLLIIGGFARLYYPRRAGNQVILHSRQILPSIPGLDYGQSSRTLLIAMNTRCQFCTESIPFYNRLAEAALKTWTDTQIVAVFVNPQEEVRRYARDSSLKVNALPSVELTKLGISATPSIILIDQAGRVMDSWVGRLSNEREMKVFSALGAK